MSTHELLPEYILGTLEPAEAVRVEALLTGSEEARAELRTLRTVLVTLTEALPRVEPPTHVWDNLSAQLEPLPTLAPIVRLPKRSSYLGWAVAACLALVAVGELVWLGSSRSAYREAQREAVLVADFLSNPEVQRISLQGRQRQGIGSVLRRPDGEALFVLSESPPEGQSYQAWGHTNNDWEPGSRERLTSLEVSDDAIFEVETQAYAALYLSLEPAGGSPQPTFPVSRVSLNEPVASSPLTITAPADGAVIAGDGVIVSGVVAPNVTYLSYVLNGETRQTTTVSNRFTFTAKLRRGENLLVVRAQGPMGTVTEALTLTRP